jgi:hypothetical protein
MKKAIRKSRGGKRLGSGRKPTGTDPARTFRLSDEFMARVDDWAAQQDDTPSRSEAIRQLVETGLAKPQSRTMTCSFCGEEANSDRILVGDRCCAICERCATAAVTTLKAKKS